MTTAIVVKYAIELVAVLLLALGIKGLSKVRSARSANLLAAIAANERLMEEMKITPRR